TPTRGSVHLVLRGTNFQIKVWEALIRIEPGRVLSYAQLARALGMPRAPRTVGSAIAANTIGYLIPCHRVIRAGGEVGDYRWGGERKLALLGHEAAQHGASAGQGLRPARSRLQTSRGPTPENGPRTTRHCAKHRRYDRQKPMTTRPLLQRAHDLVRAEWRHLTTFMPSTRRWQMPFAAALASGLPL